MPTRVLLVDDHSIVRLGLYSLLDKQQDIDIVGGVEDGQQAVEAVLALAPDLVIRNISMPNPNSFDATRKTVDELKNVKVIALSIRSSRQSVAKMLKAAAY